MTRKEALSREIKDGSRLEYEKLINEIFDRRDENDRLAELEAHILKYYLSKGYKLEKDQTKDDLKWWFSLNIETVYKHKILEVNFVVNEYPKGFKRFHEKTTKEMFDKAFEYFKVEDEDGNNHK